MEGSHDRALATPPISQICTKRESCCHASLGMQNEHLFVRPSSREMLDAMR